ncbi:Tetratricopeptide repeat protein [Paragonimus skrjabini miyazakii]|uniref:Tetratricopeptide repeat protein n=1 Tax=Paragonimus skrjabini miyazakii TaxID=59628 RepID=A0A8S9ZCU1_9TREM|nr:Tetratricopeptide repeat protein [Paragonimus skrjabini miyazakii]
MESNISLGAVSLLEKLEQLELEVISCSSNTLNELVVRKCVELVGISQLMSPTCSCLRPQYTSCLAFAYLQFKGAGFALQAEQHANSAISLLLSNAVDSSQLSENWHSGESATKHDQTMLLVTLLTYYTLARAQTLLKKEHEAIKSAQKAELILIEVLSLITPCRNQLEQKQHQPVGNLPINGEEHIESTEHQDVFTNVHSVLLKPGGGFYPALEHLQIRLAMVCGRCYFNQKKYTKSKVQYERALSMTTSLYGTNSKETIPIYHALAHLEEARKDPEETEGADVDWYRKAYDVARQLLDEDTSCLNQLEFLLSAHRLSLAYIQLGTHDSADKAKRLLEATLQRARSQQAENISELYSTPSQLTKSMNAEQFISVSQRLFQSELSQANDSGSSDTDIQQKINDAVCVLRSALSKIHLDTQHHDAAIELLQQNLSTYRITHGLYSSLAVKTQKILLSISLAQGKLKEATEQARDCLSMEEFTFGQKSKQALKTKEILGTLIGLQNSSGNTDTHQRFK